MKIADLKLTKRRKELLASMQIETVEDLLRTYPFRYENISSAGFSMWQPQDRVAFEGEIISACSVKPIGKNRSITTFRMTAFDQELQISLFNRPWTSVFALGKKMCVFGIYQGNGRVLCESISTKSLKEQLGMHAVYSLPKQMKPSDMQAAIEAALPFVHTVTDRVPQRYREKYRLMSLQDSLRAIHKPQDEKELHQAIRSLKYEEFLCFQCALQYGGTSRALKTPKVFAQEKIEELIASLPYELTQGQKEALDDILKDMQSGKVMYRMVQGDVGCGKTAVAAISLYACFLSGMQSALLAPTEILARQHVENLKEMGMEARLLVSSIPAREKKQLLADIEQGNAKIIVGTHALFQEKVKFHNLGLVIADEQHRFGVSQRRSLIEKGETCDFLMMSATPIPRTYAHFLYGDVSLSSIRTLPKGRKPVKTVYVPTSTMKPVLANVLAAIEEGAQVYVVCPAIEEDEEHSMRAAVQIYQGMEKVLGKRMRIGLLHGDMKAQEKDAVMQEFSNGNIQILVATTVIEVGINVPNATCMVIYDANRFGLSTLHQLRGRCARGDRQGVCYLLSATKDAQAKERLKKLETLTDGFAIARYDLEQRGPGDLLGTRQSGLPAFVLGDFANDPNILDAAWKDAKEIMEKRSDMAMMTYAAKACKSARYMD